MGLGAGQGRRHGGVCADGEQGSLLVQGRPARPRGQGRPVAAALLGFASWQSDAALAGAGGMATLQAHAELLAYFNGANKGSEWQPAPPAANMPPSHHLGTPLRAGLLVLSWHERPCLPACLQARPSPWAHRWPTTSPAATGRATWRRRWAGRWAGCRLGAVALHFCAGSALARYAAVLTLP